MRKQQYLEIIDGLIRSAKGENGLPRLCSRYILGLERAYESIDRCSNSISLREQRDWQINLRRRKRK